MGSPDNGAGRMIYQSDLTGEQYFKYGKLGEVTENKRIVIDPLGTTRIFVTNFEIDTWGRLKTLTYPDGEIVKYTYDNGGLLTHIENTDGQVYLKSICYNKFEQRSTMVYGNNTTTYYSYDPQQLLRFMSVSSSINNVFMNNKYDYDLNFNIINIENTSSSVALNQLGGTESKIFEYDDFNRLSHSEGEWHGALEDQQFTLDMQYNSLHNIVSKVQSHQTSVLNANVYTDTNNSMDNDYSYTGGNHPHAPSTIDSFDPITGLQSEQINNTYDANGNLKLISHDNLDTGISTTRGLYWDEQNRLQAIVEDNTAYHYVYDASGERILKSSGSSADLVINGDQVTTLNNPGTYTMYPSGYLVVGTQDYTKHYYTGSQRIASRIGDLSEVNNFEDDSTLKQQTANSQIKNKSNLESKKQNLQKQLASIYKEAKIGKPNFALAPQAPVDPAEQQCQNEYDALLQYWVNMLQPPPNENLDIKDCIKNLTTIYAQTQSYCQTIAIVKEQVRCYVDLGFNRQPIWWYHPDHLGSSSYLTDYSGIPSHYYDYLPSGEEMVSQNTSVYNNFYKFSGKELDEDTGLYYFGARYYDPKWSVWLSVDAMAEKSPNAGGYNYCLGNPLRLVDPNGMAPTDIVFFNREGQEISRIKSNTIFKTYVETSLEQRQMNPFMNYIQVQMPNIIQTRTQSGEDVTGPQYQVNDYQIAASTYLTNQELNSGNMVVADKGGNIIPKSDLISVPDISVDFVKAWSMQESHAGTTGAILQVNNGGDFTPDKMALGITKGETFTTHQEINLAIRYAIGKGFGVSDVSYSDNGKTVNRSYSWKGWTEALKGYGPGAKNPNYQNYINTMQKESKEPNPKNY